MNTIKIKNLIFRIYIYFRRSVYVFLGMLNSFISSSKPYVYVVSYHSVYEDGWRFSIDTKEIKKQINYLSDKFEIIDLKTLDKIIKGQKLLLKPSVVLTFDDGYRDILKLKDFFIRNRIKPAIFLLSNTADANWTELGTKRPFLNKAEIVSLVKNGFEVGSHSKTHTNLSTLTGRKLSDEVLGSKKILEKSLGLPIHYFAYPRGKYTPEVIKNVKKAGYKLAFTMDDGIISTDTNPLLVPRIGIDRTHNFFEFKYLFSKNNINLRMIIKKSYFGRYI